MTYNQIVTEIKTILTNHAMIKEVRFASPMQWINWDSVPNFPLASYVINRGQINLGRELVYSVEMWLLDKSGVDGEYETDVTSDMHSIACDIVQIFRQGFQPYRVNTSVSWDAVSEKFEDYLSGVKFSFDISIVRQYDSCDVP
jgi:hypothetical protein